MRGDVAEHARAARGYLTSLGYPGALRGDEESTVAWGGPLFAYVMRDLAYSTEILGEMEESAELYRRANPGGGACGTTVHSRYAEQIRGFIRVSEASHGCRPTVAFRLFATSDGDRHEWYGPKRLADAGFDLARLYRGALLTQGRQGAADWDERVRALEGYADTAGKLAIPIAIARAKAGPVEQRTRALRVLSELAASQGSDPCNPSWQGWFRGHWSSMDERPIRALNATCASKLNATDLAALVRTVASLAADKEWQVRYGVAHTLGEMGAVASIPTLKLLEADAFEMKGSTICTRTGDGPEKCHPNWPVREQARTALEQIASIRRLEHSP
jgi:hypothetical protein